jgi:hypothetical protein
MNAWVWFWRAVAHHLQEQFDWFDEPQRHLPEDCSGVDCGIPMADDIPPGTPGEFVLRKIATKVGDLSLI